MLQAACEHTKNKKNITVVLALVEPMKPLSPPRYYTPQRFHNCVTNSLSIACHLSFDCTTCCQWPLSNPCFSMKYAFRLSNQRRCGCPLFRVPPEGSQLRSALFHLPSFLLALSPASRHFRLLCATTQSSKLHLENCASTKVVQRFIHSTHDSPSILSSSSSSEGPASLEGELPELLEPLSTSTWEGRFQCEPNIHLSIRRCAVCKAFSRSTVMVQHALPYSRVGVTTLWNNLIRVFRLTCLLQSSALCLKKLFQALSNLFVMSTAVESWRQSFRPK